MVRSWLAIHEGYNCMNKETNSNKVFCINCVSLNIWYTDCGSTIHCNHPTCFTTSELHCVFGILDERIRDYNTLNKDCTCQYYKRKWWKFWIK